MSGRSGRSRGSRSSGRRPGPARPGPKRGALRVVAGGAGGQRLDTPGGTDTRPTSDRVREAVFNALESLGAIEGARVLDPFAGSGALGVEALSRGAAEVTFVERDPTARAVVEQNLAATGLAGKATVLGGDGVAAGAAHGTFDLILLDPPYEFVRWAEALDALARVLEPHGVLVIESNRAVGLPGGLHHLRERTYGSTVVTFASQVGATS